MTAFSFGVLVFAICLSAQVHCQNVTSSASLMNYTTAVSSTGTPPAIASNTYGDGVNQTSAGGGGSTLQPAACVCLLSFALATFLVCCC